MGDADIAALDARLEGEWHARAGLSMRFSHFRGCPAEAEEGLSASSAASGSGANAPFWGGRRDYRSNTLGGCVEVGGNHTLVQLAPPLGECDPDHGFATATCACWC